MKKDSKLTTAEFYARIGAGFFVAWGLLHILGGSMILAGSLKNAQNALSEMAGGAGAAEFAGAAGPVVGSLLSYHAFNLTWLGAAVVLVGVRLNWHNTSLGFWLNAGLVGMVDLGLGIWFLATGYIALSEGMAGISLFVGAVLFSGVARVLEGRPGRAPAIVGKNELTAGGLGA